MAGNPYHSVSVVLPNVSCPDARNPQGLVTICNTGNIREKRASATLLSRVSFAAARKMLGGIGGLNAEVSFRSAERRCEEVPLPLRTRGRIIRTRAVGSPSETVPARTTYGRLPPSRLVAAVEY